MVAPPTRFPARPSASRPPLSVARTDIGLRRATNEDAVVAEDGVGLWAVVDGMGGHGHGEVAAHILADALAHVRPWGDLDAAARTVERAILGAHWQIRDTAEARGWSPIGATVACLASSGGSAVVTWVGDCRVYRFGRGGLERLTRDHSVVEQLVAAGEIGPEEAEHHPSAHLVTRAVGAEAEVVPESARHLLAPRTLYLLCTDGLTRCVPEARIAAILAGHPRLADKADALLGAALAAAAPDNVSLVVVGDLAERAGP